MSGIIGHKIGFASNINQFTLQHIQNLDKEISEVENLECYTLAGT